MKFDEHGHVLWTPRTLFALAESSPLQLVNRYLLAGTPRAFADHAGYCEFLEAVASRTGVHPRNLFLRGSCHIGFSIAPDASRLWGAMRDEPDPSDLDLVIVDHAYFTRFEREVRWWEERNPVEHCQARAADAFLTRRRDRQYNCCRDTALPPSICVHHNDAMREVASMKHCGIPRTLSAFVYPDWHSVRRRYESDLNVLIKGVMGRSLPAPVDEPFA